MDDGWSGTVRVVRGSTLLLERAAGDMTPTTRSQASSISKSVLAVTALQLVDREALTLHDPVERWIDHLPAAWRGLTLHQLLSHTAGLGHWRDVPGLDFTNPPPRPRLDDLLARAPLLHRPGSRWAYSGIGYLLAARVIEAAAREPYADVVQRAVFDRVGMPATSSGRFPLGDEDVALGHHDGDEVAIAPELTAVPGTGDVWTSTADLLRFAHALRSGHLLSESSLAAMFTAHVEIEPEPSSPAQPTIAQAYGYGTFLGTVGGRQAWYHPGDNPGYESLLAWLPDEGADIAVLTNDDGPSLDLPLRVALAAVDGAGAG